MTIYFKGFKVVENLLMISFWFVHDDEEDEEDERERERARWKRRGESQQKAGIILRSSLAGNNKDSL